MFRKKPENSREPSERNPLINPVFAHQRFQSTADLHSFMEKLRSSSPYEFSGFTEKTAKWIHFYFSTIRSKIAVLIPGQLQNSWHSHPQLDQEDLNNNKIPFYFTPQLRKLSAEIISYASTLEEADNSKISGMDIINFATAVRQIDRVSLPPNHLLIINLPQAKPDSLIVQFHQKLAHYLALLQQKGNDLMQSGQKKPHHLCAEIAIRLKFTVYALKILEQLLKQIGTGKITRENYLSVLEKLGIPFILEEVFPDAEKPGSFLHIANLHPRDFENLPHFDEFYHARLMEFLFFQNCSPK